MAPLLPSNVMDTTPLVSTVSADHGAGSPRSAPAALPAESPRNRGVASGAAVTVEMWVMGACAAAAAGTMK